MITITNPYYFLLGVITIPLGTFLLFYAIDKIIYHYKYKDLKPLTPEVFDAISGGQLRITTKRYGYWFFRYVKDTGYMLLINGYTLTEFNKGSSRMYYRIFTSRNSALIFINKFIDNKEELGESIYFEYSKINKIKDEKSLYIEKQIMNGFQIDIKTEEPDIDTIYLYDNYDSYDY